ncbi:hypothetical protein GQ457_13G006480 [Hibiscus cannabinus]
MELVSQYIASFMPIKLSTVRIMEKFLHSSIPNHPLLSTVGAPQSSVLLISPSVGNTRSITEFGNSYGNTPRLTTPTSLGITPLTPTLTYHRPRLCQHLNQTKPTPTTQHSPKTTLVTETRRATVEQGGDNQTKGVPRVLGAESHKQWSGTMQGRVGQVRMGTRNRTVVAVQATDGGGGSVGFSPKMEK